MKTMKTKIMKVINQISVRFAFVTVIMFIVVIVLWMSNVPNMAMWAWRITVATFIIAASTRLSLSFSKSA